MVLHRFTDDDCVAFVSEDGWLHVGAFEYSIERDDESVQVVFPLTTKDGVDYEWSRASRAMWLAICRRHELLEYSVLDRESALPPPGAGPIRDDARWTAVLLVR